MIIGTVDSSLVFMRKIVPIESGVAGLDIERHIGRMQTRYPLPRQKLLLLD